MWMVVAVILTTNGGSYEFQMRSMEACMRIADAQQRGLQVDLIDPEGQSIQGIKSVECQLHDMSTGIPRQAT